MRVEEIKEEKKPIDTPKVTSFSQLDTVVPEVAKADEAVPLEPEPATETQSAQEEKGEESSEAKDEKASSDEIKEWLKEVRPDTTKVIEKSGGPNFKVIVLIIIILAILGAVVGGIFYYQKGVVTKVELTPTPSEEEPTPVAEPTKSEETLDLKKYSVNVLNGSGTAGEAGKVKDLIAVSGFDSEKVSTGNASSYDFKSTEVVVKKDTPSEVFEKIKEALSKDYEVVKSDTELPDSSKYDVVITVGTK